jgi:hypothetical protein
MRKPFSIGLVCGIAVLGMPMGTFAAAAKAPAARQAQQTTGGLQGDAKDATQRPMPQVRVQVRGPNGNLIVSGSTNAAGQFAFIGLPPGSYTIEIVDALGNIVGTSAAVSVTAGATATVTITAAAAGAIAAAAGGGVSLLGLGTIGTVAVVGGAAALTTAAVVATKDGKIVVCHKPAGSSPQTIEIKDSARDAHMAHGDTLGACPASPSR